MQTPEKKKKLDSFPVPVVFIIILLTLLTIQTDDTMVIHAKRTILCVSIACIVIA